MPKLDQAIADQVAQDHQPREAIDDEGATHVLFWDDKVRSVLLKDWVAEQVKLATKQTEQAAARTLRTTILQLARGAEGKMLNVLTQGEVRSLLALLLWKAGGVKADGTVRTLEEWL